MNACCPATSFLTALWLRPQKEHASCSLAMSVTVLRSFLRGASDLESTYDGNAVSLVENGSSLFRLIMSLGWAPS
jgi:hypothetical protein